MRDHLLTLLSREELWALRDLLLEVIEEDPEEVRGIHLAKEELSSEEFQDALVQQLIKVSMAKKLKERLR